eukprot:1525542-Amphidinium_carterae.1
MTAMQMMEVMALLRLLANNRGHACQHWVSVRARACALLCTGELVGFCGTLQVHERVLCDGCDMYPIIGRRYKD